MSLTITKVEYHRGSPSQREIEAGTVTTAERPASGEVTIRIGIESKPATERIIALSLDEDSLDWQLLDRLDEINWGTDAEQQ
jgi:hypothetical protein